MPSSATVRRPDRTYGTVCKLMRHDLEAAGLPYRDASGRVADFHALRHSYITALAMSKAPVRVIQSLARHSTPSLTFGVYAHVGLYDQTTALDALPGLTAPEAAPKPAALAATGTDGPNHKPTFAPHLRPAGDGDGRTEAETGGTDAPRPSTNCALPMDCNPLESEALDASGRVLSVTDGSGGGGIRTHGWLAPS